MADVLSAILDFIISIVLSALRLILPGWNPFDENMTAQLGSVIQQAAVWDHIFPFGTMFTIIGIIIAIEIYIIMFKLGKLIVLSVAKRFF